MPYQLAEQVKFCCLRLSVQPFLEDRYLSKQFCVITSYRNVQLFRSFSLGNKFFLNSNSRCWKYVLTCLLFCSLQNLVFKEWKKNLKSSSFTLLFRAHIIHYLWAFRWLVGIHGDICESHEFNRLLHEWWFIWKFALQLDYRLPKIHYLLLVILHLKDTHHGKCQINIV